MIPASAILPRCALTRYDEHGDPRLSVAEQALLRMRWFDWVSADDLCTAMDLHGEVQRQAVSSALRQLRKRGLIERRRSVIGIARGSSYEYRLVALKSKRGT